MDTTNLLSGNIKGIKVKDLEAVIKLMKELYSIHTVNSEMVSILQKLSTVLHPYQDKDATEFIELLKVSIESEKKNTKKEKEDKLKNISYQEFVKNYRQGFTKEELTYLSHRFFNISSSRMKRLGKEEVLDIIEDAIDNRETLASIARRASVE
ncbi:MAG: hypothetical protein PHU34_11700 [Candidatus Methanoperedens sp.]|nr:hypothetical protein [Candidatus Methanoperedens sp.]